MPLGDTAVNTIRIKSQTLAKHISQWLTVIMVALTIAACGGGGGGSESSAASSSGSSPSPTPAPPVTFDSDNNNSFASADPVTTTGTFAGSSHDADDTVDYFAFTAPRGTNYRITLKWDITTSDLALALYNSSRALTQNSTALHSNSEWISSFTLSAGELCYLVVDAVNTGGIRLNYSLTLEEVIPVTPPTDPDSRDFATASTITQPGLTYADGASVNNNDDRFDYYKFTATENAEYEVQLNWADAAHDLDMVVYDATENIVGTAINKNVRPEIVADIQLIINQSIYIRVEGFDTASTNAAYELNIVNPSVSTPPSSADVDNNGSPGEATVFAGTGSATGAVDGGVDSFDYYSFAVPIDGNYDFDLNWNSNAYDLDIQILNAAEYVIANSVGVNSSNESILNMPLTAGTLIYIAVKAFSTNGEVVDYKLSISND